MHSYARDALRELRTGPFIIGAAVLTLGAAIGMTVAMVGLVDRALLSPPPSLSHPDRLVSLSFRAPDQTDGPGMITTSYPEYDAVRRQVPAFSGAAAFQNGPSNVRVDGDQVEARTLLISPDYFEVLGVAPRVGPGIGLRDEPTRPSAVVSHAFWRSAFGARPDILGRRLTLSGIDYDIAGVMPRGFSGHSALAIDVWVPIGAAMRDRPGWDQVPFTRIVSVIARLTNDVSASVAAEQAGTVLGHGVTVSGITGVAVGATERRIALWLTAVSALVMVIGLANAATLLLVQGARRRHENAIRAALGASRSRLMARVVVQAVLIGAAGTAVSLILGSWLDEAVRRVLLPTLAPSGQLGLRAAMAAALAGVLATAVAALSGASSLARHGDSLAARGHHGRIRFHRALLLVQTAICVLLLAGAGMFWRSLRGLLDQDFGMQMDRVLVVDYEPGPSGGQDASAALSNALESIRALPGVHAATPMQTLPFGAHHVPPISIPGHADPPNVDGQLPFLIASTPELFDVLGIELVAGRRFTAADERGAPVVIVNETMARAAWPGEAAVGKCIRIGFDPDFDPSADGPPVPSAAVPCRAVIGVARDVRQRSVVPADREDRLMQYYVPWAQVPPPPGIVAFEPAATGLVIRTTGDPASLVGPVRRLIVAGRPELPFVRVRPYLDLLARQLQPWRMGVALLGLFSALAVGVAGVGLYAAFAHAVFVRRREMAIRLAIGATATGVVRLVLREAATLAAAGAGIGAIGAVLGGRTLQSMLFGIVPTDPAVLAVTALIMLLVVLVATWLPAVRASRAEPASLLKAE